VKRNMTHAPKDAMCGRPLTGDELEKKWDSMSEVFHLMAPTTSQIMYILATQVKVSSSEVKEILEVGSGDGYGTKLLCFMKNPSARLHVTDLSSSFLDRAKKRVEGEDVSFVKANAEQLPFEDKFFDCYVANYVLHLVTDPEQMLKEARRVTKDGGVAGFTIWGRKEFSPHLTVMPATVKQLDLPWNHDTHRSPFHLGADIDIVRNMILGAGFSRVLGWYELNVVDVHDAKSWVQRVISVNPTSIEEVAKLEPEVADKLRNTLMEAANEMYFAKGRPMTVETMILIAQA